MRADRDSAISAEALLDAVVAAKPGGEHRSGQHAMCRAVAKAFETGEHLLVEAPTGTGKSVAYAVAAVHHLGHASLGAPRGAPSDARRDQEEREQARVVIATATKALQEQLCDEDLPLVAQALEPLGVSFTWALLKGRSNYVCPAKLDELAAGEEPDGLFEPTTTERRRRREFGRVSKWAAETDSGDRAELTRDVADEVWQSVSTTARDCPGAANCAAGDRCFAERARDAARAADVVVTNTSLYAAHLASGGHVLPEHDAVVLDEAHLAEDIVADGFGVDVHGGRLRHLAAQIARLGPHDTTAGALRDHAARLDALLERLGSGSDDRRVKACEGELGEVLAAIRPTVVDARTALRAPSDDAEQEVGSRRRRALKAAQALDDDLGRLLDPAGYATQVAWIEPSGGRNRCVLAPVEIAGILTERLFPFTTVVATSATLAVGGGFEVTARRFGLGHREEPSPGDEPTAADGDEVERDEPIPWRGLRVDSPFDFRTQAMLYVPRHPPDVRDASYPEAMAAELHDLITAAGGRTLALFTSWSAMRATADRCAERGGYDVLRQGDAPRRELVDALRDRAHDGGVAVFATMGFWTGVDVAGLGLTLVAIDRIPFPRPNEPLHAARRERAAARGEDPFATVDLPRAAMLLAQGAGRLVRTRDDHGVVAVLDRRLATMRYRSVLLDGLPPFRRTVDGAEVRAFLAGLAARS